MMVASTDPPRETVGLPPETRPDRWEPLSRLSTATAVIEGLRDLFTTEEPLDDAALRVAVAAVHAVEHADIVSITVLTWPDARTVAATDDRARTLDDQQYATGRGPCLQAAWERLPIKALGNADGHHLWPEFAAAAKREGVLASLSVPLLMGGLDGEQESVGSLNVYSVTANAFDPFDEALMRVYTVAAGQAITNARRWQHARETVGQLERALTSRTEIDLAKGALMAVHGCDEDEAFDRLRTESQRRNIKLRIVAQELLGHVRKPSVT